MFRPHSLASLASFGRADLPPAFGRRVFFCRPTGKPGSISAEGGRHHGRPLRLPHTHGTVAMKVAVLPIKE